LPSGNISQARIKISDVTKPNVFDMNESAFKVKQIIVISPIEASALKIGSTQAIQWKTYNVANVKLEYSTNGGVQWNVIAATIPANIGLYYWVVPDSPSEFCSVKISDAANLATYSTNQNYFSIDGVQTDIQNKNEIPVEYDLLQNYPNPFNPETVIKYLLPISGFVSLKVYNLLGEEIVSLVNEFKSAGSYEVEFNGKELPSGVFIYRIQAGSYSASKKLLLVK